MGTVVVAGVAGAVGSWMGERPGSEGTPVILVGSPVKRTVVATTRSVVLAVAAGAFASGVLAVGDGSDGKPKAGSWVLASVVGVEEPVGAAPGGKNSVPSVKERVGLDPPSAVVGLASGVEDVVGSLGIWDDGTITRGAVVEGVVEEVGIAVVGLTAVLEGGIPGTCELTVDGILPVPGMLGNPGLVTEDWTVVGTFGIPLVLDTVGN